ncbi:MAG: ceramidase domain-containing protein [Gammaproteobacteria bacterium]|nr:ceramidase domain-containing protein [Gammaproteobacteria bacterium]
MTMEYCERSLDAFWAEPVNALTNLAFIAAGIALLCLALRRPPPPMAWEVVVLIFLVFSIGVGSFLWHTLATPWSAMMDVVPITLYINVFLVSYLVRVARTDLGTGTLLFLAFHGANAGVQAALPADFLNGSVFYLPAWLALVIMAIHVRTLAPARAGPLAIAVLAFTLSLVFRSIDDAVCATLPVGTHFLWHLLNGLVLYLTTRFLMTWPPGPAHNQRSRPGVACP